MTEQAKNPKDNAAEIISIAAKAALKKAAGDSRNAAILMEQGARKNPALYKALTEPYLTDACWEAVRLQAHTHRKRIWNAPAESKPAGKEMVGTKFGASSGTDAAEQKSRVVALARGNAATLLNFPLPIQGLPRLGEADLGMLKQAAEFYRKSANDQGAKAKWLSLIIKAMPDAETKVEKLFDEKALRELQSVAGVE